MLNQAHDGTLSGQQTPDRWGVPTGQRLGPIAQRYAVYSYRKHTVNACGIVPAILEEAASVSVTSVSVRVRVFKPSVRVCEGRACVCACAGVRIILRVCPNVTLSLYTDVL